MQVVARSSRDILEARDRHVPRGIVTAHPVAVERAEGSELWLKLNSAGPIFAILGA